MAESDRRKWNERYRERRHPEAPSEVVREYYHLAAPGPALDIAAGGGRNALFLADQGFVVDAVDISDVAIGRLAEAHPGVRATSVDLDDYIIEQGAYRLIVNVNFLNRRLFPYIIEGLSPGGAVIFETYLEAPGQDGTEMQRDYLLRKNELLHAFLSLRIVYYREFIKPHAKGEVLTASLAAVKNG